MQINKLLTNFNFKIRHGVFLAEKSWKEDSSKIGNAIEIRQYVPSVDLDMPGETRTAIIVADNAAVRLCTFTGNSNWNLHILKT